MLVSFALAFSIAAIISVQAGVDASHANTQDMIDGIVLNTQERVNSTVADYNSLIENVRQGMEDVSNVTGLQLRQIQVMSSSFRGMGGEGDKGGGGFPGGEADQSEPITDDIIDSMLSIDGVEDIVPVITERVGEDMRKPDYVIYGFPIDDELNEKYQYLPETIEGRQLSENDSSAVLINADLKYFFNASVGDNIEIEGKEFTVVGICSSVLSLFGSPVYMNVSDAQAVVGLESDEYTSLYVYAVNETVVDTVAYDIEEAYTDYRVVTYGDFGAGSADRVERMQEMQLRQLEDEKNATVAKLEEDMNTQISQLEGDMNRIESTGDQIVLISAITAGLIVLFMMFYTVKERVREIGTLKALGFTGASVMSQFVMEGTIIGFIGGAIGIVIALVAAPFLSDVLLPSSEVYASSSVSLWLVLLAVCMTAILGALGSIYPAWDASRKSPVEAMRHE